MKTYCLPNSMLGTKNNKNEYVEFEGHNPSKQALDVSYIKYYLLKATLYIFFFWECYTYMLRKFKDFLGPLEAGREGPSLKMLTLYRLVFSRTLRQYVSYCSKPPSL